MRSSNFADDVIKIGDFDGFFGDPVKFVLWPKFLSHEVGWPLILIVFATMAGFKIDKLLSPAKIRWNPAIANCIALSGSWHARTFPNKLDKTISLIFFQFGPKVSKSRKMSKIMGIFEVLKLILF